MPENFSASLFFFRRCFFAGNQTGLDSAWRLWEVKEGRGLSIRSNPGNAVVFIDGIERGSTPFISESVRPGEYSVRLEKEGYRDRNFKIHLYPGSFLELALELEEASGRLVILVQAAAGLPLNPQINIDGRDVDGTNLILPAGLRNVKVRSFGWEEQSADVFISDESVQDLVFTLRPAEFRLYNAGVNRPRFNPLNAGSLGIVDINFAVSSPGYGNLVIRKENDEIVFSRELGPFTTWVQNVQWNGRDRWGEILPDGLYHITVNVRSGFSGESEPVETRTLQIHIDSSRIIRPLSISSGKSGLLYAPLPELLPAKAFQIEGNFLFGYPPTTGAAWNTLPFAAAFRFSPVEFLEIAAAVNVLPVFGSGAYPGIGGSVKWVIVNPSIIKGKKDFIPGFAAGAVFSWAAETDVTPFGMGSGIEIFLPFSAGYKNFTFLLTPAVLWTGDRGFPWEGIPRFLLSGGLMFRTKGFVSGISARSEFRYKKSASLMLGGELKFYPLFSNLAISLNGGVWIKNSAVGGFGGAGMGIIY